MRASDLLAGLENKTNAGYLRCHWCGAPCDPKIPHDDVPFLPFQESTTTALCPAEHFICLGCGIYKQTSVTVMFLEGGLKDRQNLARHSWLLDGNGVRGIRRESHWGLYDYLLAPPLRFCLSLLREPGGKLTNLLQLAVVNDFKEIKADTPLAYTLDNHRLEYTIYELGEGLRHGTDGKLPGVRTLIELLGPKPGMSDLGDAEKRGRGRPAKSPDQPPGNPSRKVIRSQDGVPS